MAPQNRAAWVKSKQARPMVVEDAPYNPPGTDELVIRTKALAINPADWMVQDLGILVEHFPAILGMDVAGVVEEVGDGKIASLFKVGDHVISQGNPITQGKNHTSAFQHYVVAPLPLVAKVPESVPFTDAAVLPLAITTAGSCLFAKSTLALPLPPSTKGNGQVLIVWGASSSVGSVGVQLAKASGYEVYGIASAKNHDFLASVGCSKAFDYNSTTLVEDVVAALKGRTVAGSMDAISKPETVEKLIAILSKTEKANKVVSALHPEAPTWSTNDVKVTTNFTALTEGPERSQHLWRTFLEPALLKGELQYKPTAEVIGHGLENVQKGVDTVKAGVSAKKIVVTI